MVAEVLREGQEKHTWGLFSKDVLRDYFSPDNKSVALNRILVSAENEGNMRMLRRFAFTAFEREDHNLRGCSFGIYSPPGQGKTFVVKNFIETIGLPWVFVQSPILESTYMLFELIQKELEKNGIQLKKFENYKYDFILPPVVVFFDEAHELKMSMQRGDLLNPMEPDDGTMLIKEPGRKGETLKVYCRNVCWIAATTERGGLFDAFESRLPTPIEWAPAGEKELPKIVQAGLQKKVEEGQLPFAPPYEICEHISKLQRVPRLAIHGFGEKVVQQKNMCDHESWEQACKVVASDLRIDQWGLDHRQVQALTILGQRPCSQERLAQTINCRVEQLKKHVMPPLQQFFDGGPFVVSLSGRGMCVTESGLKQLELRGIKHNGHKVTAEYLEQH